MLGERGDRERVDEVEAPIAHEAVAVLDERGEVIAGFEKDDWDVRQMLAEHVEDDHVLGLERAGEADVLFVGGGDDCGDESFWS